MAFLSARIFQWSRRLAFLGAETNCRAHEIVRPWPTVMIAQARLSRLRLPDCRVAARVPLLLAVLGAGLLAQNAAPVRTAAATPVVTPEAVYAAFTLNLTRFVTWPPSAFRDPMAPLVIGTFSRDPVNAELDAAARGEVVNGHPVQTMRLQSADDVAKCHVVFLSRNTPRQAAVMQRAERKPVLMIGDGDGFLELGGHVRFVPQPPRIGLRISIENLKASGLEARSQLLRLASPP